MNKNLYINDDLLVKYILGEALPGEITAVDEWLRQSDENKKYFSQLKQVWEKSLELSPATEVNEKEAWLRFRKRIEDLPAHKVPAVVPMYQKLAKRLAAVAAVLILAISAWLLFRVPGNEPNIAVIEKQTTTKPRSQ